MEHAAPSFSDFCFEVITQCSPSALSGTRLVRYRFSTFYRQSLFVRVFSRGCYTVMNLDRSMSSSLAPRQRQPGVKSRPRTQQDGGGGVLKSAVRDAMAESKEV